MSRDWTPAQLDWFQQNTELKDFDILEMQIHIGDEVRPMYTDEEKAVSRKYPRFGKVGGDVLLALQRHGLLATEEGEKVVQTVEDWFNDIEIPNRDLIETLEKWYDGELCPGYYMDDNNEALFSYLRNLITGEKREDDEDD